MKVKRLTSEELYHYGIKGQRKGVRRFQNEDGSLTYAGKQRYLSPSKGTYTHDGTNIKRDPNSFRPTLSYHSTAVSSTGYGARKNAERKKAELDQRTEDKKRASINASEEAARRRKFYDDNAAQYTAARKKYQRDSEAPEQQYQEWKKKQKEKDHQYTMYADNHKPHTENEKFRREFMYNEYMKRSEKEVARSKHEGEYKKELARQEQNRLSDQKRAEEVKSRSEAYKQEAASIKERSEKRQAEAKKFTSKLKLFGKSFKEVHTENINKGKSKVQSILAKLKR